MPKEEAVDRKRKPVVRILLTGLLLVLTAIAFAGVLGADFIGFDDDKIVTENTNLRLGLSLRGIQWAFTNATFGKWTPMAWLTHLFDVRTFGLNAHGHHLTSLLLHLAGAALLFNVLAAITGNVWRSWLVGILFALHPLHVEPVAWVAARRDVVSTPFWIATMYAHYAYCSTRRRWWYVASILCLTVGLMGKSMLMTMPFVLLIMDFWPLGRLGMPKTGGQRKIAPHAGQSLGVLLAEKIPHAAIAVLFALIAGWNESQLGAVKSLVMFPVASRIGNALVSYLRYLALTIVPRNLAVWYPHHANGWSPWLIAACALFLVGATATAIFLRRRYPWLVMGWFWYLGTLVPVIGLVQLGGFSIADRFSYMTLTGIFIIAAWALPDLKRLTRGTRAVTVATISAIVVLLLVLTRAQVELWKNGITLFEHTVAVTEENYMGHYNLGTFYEGTGNTTEAINHYREAIRISPNYSKAHNNLGAMLLKNGNSSLALPYLGEAVRYDSENAQAQFNLGMAYLNLRKPDQAVPHLEKAALKSPGDPEIRKMLDFARDWMSRVVR